MMRLVVVLCFWAGTLWGQSPFRVDPSNVPSTERHHYQTETQCNGNWVTEDPQRAESTAEEAAENTVHEAVHRQQLAGHCIATMALWDQDITARVAAEAQASCEGWKAGGTTLARGHTRAVQAAVWWVRYASISYDTALALFDQACGYVPPLEPPYSGRTSFHGAIDSVGHVESTARSGTPGFGSAE